MTSTEAFGDIAEVLAKMNPSTISNLKTPKALLAA